jgi:hypothetical protein
MVAEIQAVMVADKAGAASGSRLSILDFAKRLMRTNNRSTEENVYVQSFDNISVRTHKMVRIRADSARPGFIYRPAGDVACQAVGRTSRARTQSGSAP